MLTAPLSSLADGEAVAVSRSVGGMNRAESAVLGELGADKSRADPFCTATLRAEFPRTRAPERPETPRNERS